MQARASVIRSFMLMLLGCIGLGYLASSAALAQGVPEGVEKIGRAIGRKLQGKRRVFGYTDDRGRLVYAVSMDQVPAHLQQYTKEVDAPDGMFDDGDDDELTADLFSFGGEEAKRAGLATVYRVTTPDGRIVYTNLAERVPTAQRGTAAMDLSRISLNTQVGTEIDKRIREQHERLIGSKYCQDARSQDEAPVVPLAQRLWREQRPLVICLGAALLFLLLTPLMVDKVGASAWGRTLSMAIPALVIAGASTYAVTKGSAALSELRGKAAPCKAATWDKLAQKPETGLRDHLSLVQQLQDQVAAADKLQADRIDRETKIDAEGR